MVLGIHDPTLKLGFSKFDPSNAAVVTDSIFKEFYLPGVRDQLNNKRVMARMFQRDSEHVSADGNFASIELNVSRNESSMSVGEYGRLPEPGEQGYGRADYTIRYNYARITITGQAMGSSKTNRGSFIRALDAEMQGVVRDRQVEDNRIYFGDGTGTLAQVTSVAGQVVTCKNPGGFVNPGSGVQYIRPGMRLGFVNVGGAALRTGAGSETGFKVLSVDGAAGTIEFEALPALPAAAALNDPIVRVSWEDVSATDLISTSYNNEPFGVAAIVDDGNPSATRLLGNLDATTLQIWQAPVVHNNGIAQPFNQGMLDHGLDALDISGDGVVKIWMTTHGIRRQHLHDMVANKRFVNTISIGDGSFKAIEHNGIPLVVDKDCTRGRVYGFDPSSLYMFTETDYFWMDGDNSVLVRDPNRDLYSATLAKYCECGTDKRNANVLIKDIADS